MRQNYGSTCYPTLTLQGDPFSHHCLTKSPNLNTFKKLSIELFLMNIAQFGKNKFGTARVHRRSQKGSFINFVTQFLTLLDPPPPNSTSRFSINKAPLLLSQNPRLPLSSRTVAPFIADPLIKKQIRK